MIPSQPELEVMSGHAFMNDQRPVVVRTCQREVTELFGGRRSPTGAVVLQAGGAREVVVFAPAVHRVEVAWNGLYGVVREFLRHAENVPIDQKFADCQFVGRLLLDLRL